MIKNMKRTLTAAIAAVMLLAAMPQALAAGIQIPFILTGAHAVNGQRTWTVYNPNDFTVTGGVETTNCQVQEQVSLEPGVNFVTAKNDAAMIIGGVPYINVFYENQGSHRHSMLQYANDYIETLEPAGAGEIQLIYDGISLGDIQFISPVYRVDGITKFLDFQIYASAREGFAVDKIINVSRNLEVQNYSFLNFPLSKDYTSSVKAVFREAASGPSLEEPPGIPDGEPVAITSQYAYLYGYSDSVAGPEGYLLREEAAAIVHRMMKQNDQRGGFSKPAVSSFPDSSPETWSFAAMEYMNYINVYESGAPVRPSERITRGEVAKIISHALRLRVLNQQPLQFDDITEEHTYYYYVKAMADYGYFIGQNQNEIGPDQLITRAEFVTMFNRIIGRASDAYNYQETIDGVQVSCEFTDLAGHWAYVDFMKATHSFTETAEGFAVDFSKRQDRNELDEYYG